jgi:prepilin-type N-terminal cleavage/methylation domain-containing protein
MNNKSKKTVKGMTLVEVLIAIFVLGVMGTLMAKAATISCSMMKSANHMTNKVEVEAPLAAAQENDVSHDADVTVVDDDVTIAITGSFDADSVKTLKTKKYATAQKTAGDKFADTSKTVDADLVYFGVIDVVP